MNKLLPFLAFAVFALVACSEDKPAPTHTELCAKKPVTKECLVGRWYLDKVEGVSSKCSPRKDIDNYLKLNANGQFFFKSGYSDWVLETNGNWGLIETGMQIDCKSGDCADGINYPTDVTIEVLRSGGELRISTTGYTGFLQCSGSAVTLTEVYTWQGSN